MSKDIVVIVPVHEFNDNVGVMLDKAVRSVPREYPIVISTTKEVIESTSLESRIVSYNAEGINSVGIYELEDSTNFGKSDFCTLVNNAVSKTEYGWFSILEFDDTFNSIWFTNVIKYMEYMPETSIFLPLTELTDAVTNKFIGYGNEAPWASSFSEEIGSIDHDCLEQYFDFYMTGGVYNTKDWKDMGGLKPSIKLTFWYELLLRYTHNEKKVYVIPKLGYNHYLNRGGSLFDYYQNNVDSDESEFWLNLAKQDYFYKTERESETYNYKK
ncbi:MAG: hypothetical protein IKT40_02660 [Bacilli bacterium]|nr:hypothetical protein [Bacilli bacterium]